MSSFKDGALEFVRRIAEVTGQKPTQIARSAGLAPSTLNNFLRDPDTHTLSLSTAEKLDSLCADMGLSVRFRDFLPPDDEATIDAKADAA